MSLFISCTVEDVDRATAFYSALGWTRNADMSGPENACFAIAPDQFVMLSSRAAYASVGGTEDLVGGPDTPSKVTVSFDLASREAVDDLVERARAAGGRIGDTDEYPSMYQRQFDDLDGYPLVAVLDAPRRRARLTPGRAREDQAYSGRPPTR